MKVVYYYNRRFNIAPVKQFLSKYDLKLEDTKKQTNHKVKVLAFIDQTVKFIAEHKGQPIPPIAKTIRGHPFHEMRIKDGSNLIRILYFSFCQEKLVLLNAFEKPELYNKGLKKKIEKQILKIIEQTKIYYQDFIKNSQNYEEYK